MYIILFFFFSSRRRHTRYWRDWSSDVCSSDLGPAILFREDDSPIDEDALRRGIQIQNPAGKCIGGGHAIADRRVQESSAEQERHAEITLTQVRASCVVRRLDEHRIVADSGPRSEEHTSELQSRQYLVCRLLLEKKKRS